MTVTLYEEFLQQMWNQINIIVPLAGVHSYNKPYTFTVKIHRKDYSYICGQYYKHVSEYIACKHVLTVYLGVFVTQWYHRYPWLNSVKDTENSCVTCYMLLIKHKSVYY